MNIIEVLGQGGPSIWLLVFLFVVLSFLALTTIIERIWFWSKILTREREIVGRVLESALRDWNAARDIARRSLDQPIGRFLHAALDLQNPEPEIFQLALQASADEELAAMRRGEKILEAVIAISPLLGLLGTVLGLIRSLGSIRLGDLGTTSTEGVTLGISDALTSTAAGLIIAILSLAFYRLFQGLVLGQVKVFRQAGNELELLYRKDWSNRDTDISKDRRFSSRLYDVVDSRSTRIDSSEASDISKEESKKKFYELQRSRQEQDTSDSSSASSAKDTPSSQAALEPETPENKGTPTDTQEKSIESDTDDTVAEE
ncbi:MAG: MotA/TolQ/ExbB proton channel family protein [Cyanobacteria bacterium P01_F01_bin.150]